MMRVSHSQSLLRLAQVGAFLLAAIASGINAGDQEPSYIREVTDAVIPVDDGYVSRVFIRGEKLIYMWHGRGQAGYDGEVREADLGKAEKWRTIVELGTNSLMSKDQGIYSEQPHLLAVPRPDLYIIYLYCCKDFPSPDSKSSGGVTGNVVLYDAKAKAFTNLTKLDGRDGKSIGTCCWFSDESVLLLEESEVGESGSVGPKEGARKPVCMKLSDCSTYPIDDFPRIKKWYETRGILDVKWKYERDETGKATGSTWTVTHKEKERKLTFSAGMEGVEDIPTFHVFVVGTDLLCVGTDKMGTCLMDFEGTVDIRLSAHVAICYDYETQLITLRSVDKDRNGQHRYWVMDLNKYLEHVKQRVNGK